MIWSKKIFDNSKKISKKKCTFFATFIGSKMRQTVYFALHPEAYSCLFESLCETEVYTYIAVAVTVVVAVGAAAVVVVVVVVAVAAAAGSSREAREKDGEWSGYGDD